MSEIVKVGIYSEVEVYPDYKHIGDSGMDVISLEESLVNPGDRCLFKTGLYFNIPQGYEIQVRPRSGLALKEGITVLNSPGTIDSNYKGELGVILLNTSIKPFQVNVGDRICQIVLQKVPQIVWETYPSKELLETSSRGEGGFGSTGKN